MLLTDPTELAPDESLTVASPERPPFRILAPGRNCWRVAQADRAAVLVDGAAYYTRLELALRSARRSVMIVGWDFDGSIRLRPDVPEDESPRLGPLLRSLLEANPELEVRILVWSVAVVHAPGDPKPLLFGADWQDHPRLHLKLDTQHPIYAAHHQKIVCIDDRLAFCGGMDLTVRRWDTPEHRHAHPARLNADGTSCAPIHDIQMAVDGDAARHVADLVRRRWETATGETLPACPDVAEDPWPADLEPHFTSVPVAIARTMPEWGGRPGAREAAQLTADALKAARQVIYLEAQYMTTPFVGEILERHLQSPDGPEVVVLMTHQSRGVTERLIMGNNRDRLIRRLRKADRFDRLRVYYPHCVDETGARHQILVHAKLVIVDDVFLRVGSSNLNNRSIGLDTECDLAIEAQDERTRRAIRLVRESLVAEHVDTTPERVAEAVERHDGSVVKAMDELNHKPRGVCLFEAMSEPGPTEPALGTWFFDPVAPFGPLGVLRRKRAFRVA